MSDVNERERAAEEAGRLFLEVTIDAVEAEETARFWAAALGYRTLYHRDPYTVMGPVDGAGPRVLVQRVEERDPGKTSVHLDLRVTDPRREVGRLCTLGARVQRVVEEAGTRWTVMADPEGTLFCVCPARPSRERPAGANGP
jgi:hypothetical protein